ncbi:MAG TPA: sulfatase-like hydrolase/transferase [Candidatus Desulfaltia sp.]|nr:sulfatase-like hydrolase/transferase [Candidatus Desulfaltia sp.]
MYARRACAAFAIASILLGASSCGNRAPSRDLPATFVWSKDQSVIDPASGRTNVWGGFEVRDGVCTAVRNTARFILWRTAAAETRLSIEYALRGKPCRFLANGSAVGELAPSPQRTAAGFGVRLNVGFNFLEFDKTANDVLRIYAVLAGPREPRRRRHLEEGESLTLGTERASGRLLFRGRGVLGITEVLFHEGRRTARTFGRKPGLLSRRIVYAFDDPSPGFVTFAATSGSFDVVENSVVRTPAATFPGKGPRFAGSPDVFIFLIDACRPDHLGVYGYARPTSPNLDRFAVDAVVFENAYANASFTRSSVATLFTGLYPERHKVRILMNKLSERLLTIPVYLKGKDYKTSLFTATGNVSTNTGFARGVDDYFPHIGEWRRGEERAMPRRFDGWLDRDGPLFSYVHFMEPHLPIVPPAPFRDMFSAPKARAFVHGVLEEFQRKINAERPFGPDEVRAVVDNYDATVAYVDGELGKLLRSLKDRGLYDESLIIVLSDHGESLYEREYWGHGAKVYEETARVPLIVKFPASMGLKGRVEAVVELAGAFPTLLDLFGQEVGLDGKSWLPAIIAPAPDDAMAVARSFTNVGDFGLRWRDWYAIVNLASGMETLYRRSKPVFTEIGAGEEDDIRLLFKVKFLEWLGRFAEADDQPMLVDLQALPKNELENLRSLGYIK